MAHPPPPPPHHHHHHHHDHERLFIPMPMHAGATAGALSISTTQPLDMVRIRMQTLASTSSTGLSTSTRRCATATATIAASTSGGIAAPSPSPCRGSLQLLTHMIRNEGSLSPFKGMSFPLLTTALQSALIFQVYGVSLRFLEGSRGPPVTAHNHTHYLDSREGIPSTCTHRGETSNTQIQFVRTFMAGSAAGFVQVVPRCSP